MEAGAEIVNKFKNVFEVFFTVCFKREKHFDSNQKASNKHRILCEKVMIYDLLSFLRIEYNILLFKYYWHSCKKKKKDFEVTILYNIRVLCDIKKQFL